jgi:hypothetical protein
MKIRILIRGEFAWRRDALSQAMAGDGRWTLPEQIVLVEAVQRFASPHDSLARRPLAFLKGDLDQGGHVTRPI